MTEDGGPEARLATPRRALEGALRDGWRTALELSRAVGLPEREVAGHLEHLARSLKASGEKLEISPARCLGCEFEFRDRSRPRPPSRCPKCRGERITAPRFCIR